MAYTLWTRHLHLRHLGASLYHLQVGGSRLSHFQAPETPKVKVFFEIKYSNLLLLGCSRAELMLGGSRGEFTIICNRDELKMEGSLVELIRNRYRAKFMISWTQILQ